MSRNTQPVHFEYIEKGAWWPRWTQWASYNPHPHSHSQPRVQQQPQPQAAPAGSTAQQPFSIVVVNNSQAAVPMNSIMRLVSHYQTQFSQPSQQPQSTQQSAQPQQTQAPETTTSTPSSPSPSSPPVQIVIVINGNGQIGNTDSILNRLFLAQQPQTIPTSQSFINSLQQTKITPKTIAKQSQCTICMEDFQVDDSAVQLPCLHSFHHDCIKPWLSTQHTCPVCRHELPTESQTTCTPQALPTPLPVQTQQPTPSVNTIRSPSSPSLSLLPVPGSAPLAAPTATPSIPTPSTAPIQSTPTPTTTSSTPHNSPSSSPSTQRPSSLKRGFLLPPTNSQQQPQKKKRMEEEDKKDEKKSQEKKDDNEFGFKKGFLCSPNKK